MAGGKFGWGDYRKSMFFSGLPLILAGVFIGFYVFAFENWLDFRRLAMA